MIISHKHKFIYIKTVKTAGTSIQNALTQIVGPEDVVSGRLTVSQNKWKMKEVDCRQNITRGHRPDGHHNLKFAFEMCPEAKGYRVITSERNSWDKFVSMYFNILKRQDKSTHDGDYDYKYHKKKFGSWIEKVNNAKWTILHLGWGAAYMWERADYVIQYHSLHEDYTGLSEYLHLELPPLKHMNIGVHHREKNPRHYTEFYDDKAQETVEEICKREINMYNYTFGQ